MYLQSIIEACNISVNRYETVHGGDINHAFCLYRKNEKFFLKVNDAALYPQMFEREAEGLNTLRNSCNLKLPEVMQFGVAETQQYLLLEWLEKDAPSAQSWEGFGAGLAHLHQQEQAAFGWQHDNYIGRLPQRNTLYSNWTEFYTSCRIMPLAEQLYDSGFFSTGDLMTADFFCNHLQELFPEEKPSLLHGDLWGGNYLITAGGAAALIDPAVYCGHREMDIGMAKLFGGFDPKFYDVYNATYPLEKGWEQRLRFAQAYPLLVHAVLFGGHYVRAAAEAMRL